MGASRNHKRIAKLPHASEKSIFLSAAQKPCLTTFENICKGIFEFQTQIIKMDSPPPSVYISPSDSNKDLTAVDPLMVNGDAQVGVDLPSVCQQRVFTNKLLQFSHCRLAARDVGEFPLQARLWQTECGKMSSSVAWLIWRVWEHSVSGQLRET